MVEGETLLVLLLCAPCQQLGFARELKERLRVKRYLSSLCVHASSYKLSAEPQRIVQSNN